MENSQIKAECEKMSAQIEAARERIKELQKECKHEDTFQGNYAWRAGSFFPATICEYCGYPVHIETDYGKQG